MELATIMIALFLGSVGSVMLAGLLLSLKDDWLGKVSTYMMYMAGGTLLGAATLGMIPRASSLTGLSSVMLTVLCGLVTFFLLEKMILWRTCRNRKCERQLSAAGPIILIGDAFHNAIDGIVITASFLSSAELGVFVTLSVILHEIPQELGDLGILIRNGYTRRKAFWLNTLSGAAAIPAGIIAYFAMETVKPLVPYVLAFSAASFLYIALADLIPEMHRKTTLKDSLTQIFLVILGILIIYIIIHFK